MIFVPSSAIAGKGFVGMMATLKSLSGKLFWNDFVIASHACSSSDGLYPACCQSVTASVTQARPVLCGVSAGRRNSSVVRLMPVRRSSVIES